jgi:hypothetical protein
MDARADFASAKASGIPRTEISGLGCKSLILFDAAVQE